MNSRTQRFEGSKNSRSDDIFGIGFYLLRQPWIVRSACLAIACALLIPRWNWDAATLVVPALSPYVAIAATIAARCAGLTALAAAPMLLMVLVRRRWLCRYVCPTGLLADLAGRLGGRRPSNASKLPPVGQWLVWSTVGGAVGGYPLFLWLDPLAIFAGFVNAWGRELGTAAWLCAAGLPLVLLFSLLLPGLWCARICPLGAIQDFLAWPRQKFRSRHAEKPPLLWSRPLTRRIVLSGGLGVLGAAAMLRWVRRAPPLPLRPPGAAGGGQFTGLCIRCGSCASVCPSQILHPDLSEFGADSFLTPLVRFEDAYCLETCQRCTSVCPSGALRRLSPDDKPRAVIGLPRVDMDVCLLGDDHECAVCRNACPYGAIQIVFSEETYLSTPTISPDLCNGCGACQVRCPTKPVKAIVVYPPAPDGANGSRSGLLCSGSHMIRTPKPVSATRLLYLLLSLASAGDAAELTRWSAADPAKASSLQVLRQGTDWCGKWAACSEATKFFGPDCVTVAVKQGISREAAVLYPFEESHKALYEGAKKAIAAIPKCKP